jgi:hypothetical protein
MKGTSRLSSADMGAALDALGANKGLSKLSLEMMDTASDFRSSKRAITSELTSIKSELQGLSSTKITIGSQMQEQARLMSEAARSMEVSAGKMRGAERSSSGGGTLWWRILVGARAPPFIAVTSRGVLHLAPLGSMAVYAGLGGVGEVAGGGSYRAYTEQATLIAGQTGPQGQAIAYGVNPRTGRPNPVGSISGGLQGSIFVPRRSMAFVRLRQ